MYKRQVTASIDAIYAAAYEVRDFRTMQMLDWFIKEQGEEEKNAADPVSYTHLDVYKRQGEPRRTVASHVSA